MVAEAFDLTIVVLVAIKIEAGMVYLSVALAVLVDPITVMAVVINKTSSSHHRQATELSRVPPTLEALASPRPSLMASVLRPKAVLQARLLSWQPSPVAPFNLLGVHCCEHFSEALSFSFWVAKVSATFFSLPLTISRVSRSNLIS